MSYHIRENIRSRHVQIFSMCFLLYIVYEYSIQHLCAFFVFRVFFFFFTQQQTKNSDCDLCLIHTSLLLLLFFILCPDERRDSIGKRKSINRLVRGVASHNLRIVSGHVGCSKSSRFGNQKKKRKNLI